MGRIACPRIDFDDWSELAKTDPAGFEARRAQVIEEFIESAPAGKQHRLRCLQWRIDRARSKAKTPLAACIRLSQMMWESLMGEHGLLEATDDLRAAWEGGPRSKALRRKATVIPFPSSRTH